jgi:lysophospholipase L1-like esterase
MNIKKILTLLSFLFILFSCSSEPQLLSPLPNQPVILAFGDSLTYGKGANKQNSYPAQLQRLSGITIINKGISGELSEQGLQRLPQVLAETKPNLVIVCHGGNDILRKKSKQQLSTNLEKMITLIKASGAQVVLVGVPKPGLFLSANKLYKAVAKKMNVPIENKIIASVLAKNKLKSDHVHPNQKGYQKIAGALFELLKNEGAI